MRDGTALTCKHSIYDPDGVTRRSCVRPLGHAGRHLAYALEVRKLGYSSRPLENAA